MAKYALGLDFGTLSVRALLADAKSGEEVCSAVYDYPHAVMEECIPTGKRLHSNWALQFPGDYIEGLFYTVNQVMKESGIPAEDVIGIGLDFTASTVLCTKADGTPLCDLPEFEDEPHAYVKLWKHHGAEEEAKEISSLTKVRGERWMEIYGDKVSSEWMLPKILETLRHAPAVYEAADRIIDAGDWLIWLLTGEEVRSACYAGHKACYHHETGYPSKEFFKELDPRMENIVEEKLDAPIKEVGERAGFLTEEMAEKLGLKAGTPVGITIIDAHAGVLGAGVSKPGTMLIIVGTSGCHLFMSDEVIPTPGICCIVKGGTLPGYFTYEAGQSCVGDHFAWAVKNIIPARYEEEAKELGISVHELLARKLKDYKPGQTGLVALDWFNGVRSPLMDFNLNGMILGMNLLTKPEDIYLALIEATAYGTRLIIETLEEGGIPVENIVLSGGIPLKNPMLVQIYSDVCKKDIKICCSKNASAMGSAMLGIAAADPAVSGYKNAEEVVEKLGQIREDVYSPIPERAAVYEELYREYKTLQEYFGKGSNDVMKRLNPIPDRECK